jgi:hypothetical protein
MKPHPSTNLLWAFLPSVPERIGSEICRRKGHFLASERRNPPVPL